VFNRPAQACTPKRSAATSTEIRYHFYIATVIFSKSSDMTTQERIKGIVTSHPVVLFMKGTAQFPMCGFSGRAIQVLKASGVDKLTTVNVLEDDEIRQGIKEFANWPTIPQLYVNGEFVGGSDIMMEMYESGELRQVLTAAV
jgi:monothiol glutaredoxin